MKIKKIIGIVTIFLIIYVFLGSNFVQAATTYTQTVKTGISTFPASYQAKLNELAKAHPSWVFQAYYTGISWNDLIAKERNENIHRNRVPYNSPASWKNSCGFTENGWSCASDAIVKYYLDPRNFLNETQIFQFVETSYNAEIQTVDVIEKSVSGTFLDKTITCKNFYDDNVTMSYAQIIVEAAKQSNISAFYIKSKIIQEVSSRNGTKYGSDSVTGTYAGYEGYYNFFNYGAYDEGDPIANGLQFAKEQGWDSQYKAIVGGAKLIGTKYIGQGQNTAYFNKWDVVGTSILKAGQTQTVSSDDMFSHQYMTNIMDPTSQSYSTYKLYKDVLDSKITFVIPVYENMPAQVAMPQDIAVQSISLNQTTLTLNVDQKAELKVTYNPSNSTVQSSTWESSDSSVVRVWNGQIRGLKAGTATITATSEDGGKTATCKVTVKSASSSSGTTNTTNTTNTTSTTTTTTEKEITFKDVEKGTWYYDAVKYTYNQGLIQGYTKTQFAPFDKLTRGQLVTILWRLEGSKSQASIKNNFSDVGNNLYYTDAIKWASANKIVTGYGGTTKFGPEDPIIRQDLALILNRYAKYKGKTNTSTASLTSFKDYKTVSGYAENAIKWAVENGIITGNTATNGTKTIAPQANSTRAEVVVMLTRYINKFNK